jgi:CYTH domain-containing protein
MNQKSTHQLTVHRRRHVMIWADHVFEVDEYLEPEASADGVRKTTGLALAQVETDKASEHIVMPPFLKVAEEVTHNKDFRMRALARPGREPIA